MANELQIINDKDEMRSWSRSKRFRGQTLALVPTMGYLHRGHISLIEEAKKLAQVVVVSIYVNPGQFAPTEDLTRYPSDFEGDILSLKKVGVDAVFHPENLYETRNDGYPSGIGEDLGGISEEKKVVSCIEEKGRLGHQTWIKVEKLERNLCGKSRPIVFRGVATIVAKLFNIVEPDVAVFGKKDYQQWRIICRMVRDLNFGIDVIGSEIVRDSDGLAMSSRNVHLSHEERQKALSINKSLAKAKLAAQGGQISCRELRNSVIQEILEAGGNIDYAEIVDQESLEVVEEIQCPVVFCVAAWFGKFPGIGQ